MTITPADRIYFMDPFPKTVPVVPEGAKLLAYEKNRDRETGFVPGTILPVAKFEYSYGRIWYVGTEDGDYYDGAIINPATMPRSCAVISLMGDDAIFGAFRSRINPDTFHINNARRWSRTRDMVGDNPVTTFRGKSVVAAADWAAELWPHWEDSDRVVEEKVATAKDLWTIRRQKIGIVRESVARNWMETLRDENIHDRFDVPRPRLGVYMDTNVLLPTSNTLQMTDLAISEESRTTMLRMMRNQTASLNTSVRVPLRLIHHPSSDLETVPEARNYSMEMLTEVVREQVNNYEISLGTTSRSAFLSRVI